MSDTKLKACPFCGGEAKAYADNHKKVMIHCEKCKMYFGIELEIGCELKEGWKATINSKEDAIKIWNTRKPIDRIVESLNKEINGQAYLFNEAKRRGNANQMAIHEYARQCYEKAVDTVKDGVKEDVLYAN